MPVTVPTHPEFSIVSYIPRKCLLYQPIIMLPLENDGVMIFFLHYKDCIVQWNTYQFENQSVIVQSLVY